MLCAVKIIDRHLGEQKLLEMAAFLYAVRFDACFIITHDQELVQEVCTRVFRLTDGSLEKG